MAQKGMCSRNQSATHWTESPNGPTWSGEAPRHTQWIQVIPSFSASVVLCKQGLTVYLCSSGRFSFKKSPYIEGVMNWATICYHWILEPKLDDNDLVVGFFEVHTLVLSN